MEDIAPNSTTVEKTLLLETIVVGLGTLTMTIIILCVYCCVPYSIQFE